MSIRRNTLYNISGQVASLLILLATTPFYLDAIGVERYGVLNILWLLLGYFIFFDFGIGRAVAFQVARDHAKGVDRIGQVIATALSITVPLAIIGTGLLYLLLGVAFNFWDELGGMLKTESEAAYVWVALALVAMLVSGIFRGLLIGQHRFLTLNILDVSDKLMFQALPLAVALLISPSIEYLAMAVLLSRMISLGLVLAVCLPVISKAHGYGWQGALAKKLWHFGGWVTVSGVVGPLLSSFERIVVGALAGAAAVAYYSVAYNIIAPVSLVAGSLGAALFPRFAEATIQESSSLETISARFVLAVLTPMMVFAAIMAHPFLKIWLGQSFVEHAGAIPQVMIIGFWANSLALIAHARLQGSNRPRTIALIHLLELAPYVLLLFVLTHWLGAVGAAVAWTVRCVGDALLLSAKSGLLANIWQHTLIPLALILFACWLSLAFPFDELLGASLSLAIVSVSTWMAWSMFLDEETRRSAKSHLVAYFFAGAR